MTPVFFIEHHHLTLSHVVCALTLWAGIVASRSPTMMSTLDQETKEGPAPGFANASAALGRSSRRAPAPGFSAETAELGEAGHHEEAPAPGFTTQSRGLKEKSLLSVQEYKNYIISEMRKSLIRCVYSRSIRHPTFVQSIIAEWWATSIFLFFLIMSCLPGKMAGQEIFRIGTTAGFMIFVLVYSFYAVSGGNINPAVSVSLALSGRMTWPRAIGYIIAQCVGAITGVAMCKAVSPEAFRLGNGGTNQIGSLMVGDVTVPINPDQALWGEVMGTMLLCLTVLFCTDVHRSMEHPHLTALIPLAIGIVVFIDHLVLIPIDGCSVNPARSFGSAVIAGEWAHHWVFWAGPMLGAAMAAVIFRLIFAPTDAFNAFWASKTGDVQRMSGRLSGELTNMVRGSKAKQQSGGSQ